jgi:hypothetical protein
MECFEVLTGKRPQRAWFQLFVAAAVLLQQAPAWAQSDRLVSNPPLGQAFPLEAKSGDVRLSSPVLLNARTVLGTDVVLRFVYLDPNAGMSSHSGGNSGGTGGGSGGGGHGHHHGGGAGGGSSGAGTGDDSADAPPASGHPGDGGPDPFSKEKSTATEFHNEVWHEVGAFQEVLNEANVQGTTIVYFRTGQQKPQTATIDLPDGMLLAQVGDYIEVLALTEDSKAGAGGLQAGDRIQSVGGDPVPSLNRFMQTYFAVTQQARKDNQSYSFQAWRPSESRLVTIQVGAPPSIPRMF